MPFGLWILPGSIPINYSIEIEIKVSIPKNFNEILEPSIDTIDSIHSSDYNLIFDLIIILGLGTYLIQYKVVDMCKRKIKLHV